uniref:Uncharacterized protein n=1 Tax=Ascaris lumbricoides TaxID=6252 RepID=A0A9J2Q0G3_ASCLU
MAKIHFGTAECQAFVVLVLTICKRQLFPDKWMEMCYHCTTVYPLICCSSNTHIAVLISG